MLKTILKAAFLALLVSTPAVARANDAGFGFDLKRVSPGTEIPKVEISLGMRPVANDLIFVSAIKQGFFGDVGVQITPPPYGRKVLFDQAIPLLVSRSMRRHCIRPTWWLRLIRSRAYGSSPYRTSSRASPFSPIPRAAQEPSASSWKGA